MKNLITFAAAILLLGGWAWAQPAPEQAEAGKNRGLQLTEVEWTPLHDIAICGGNGRYVRAGSHRKGVMYSSAAEYDKFVPFDVSIHTFLSCVRNPYSLLYTENINAKSPRSAYGIPYSGTKGSGAWMGCVCTKLSAYVAGWGIPVISHDLSWMRKRGIIVEAPDQSAQGLQVLDVLWQKGHGRAVTDVERDEDGRVIAVEISESVSPTAIRRRFTVDEFEELREKKKITIYRTADYGRVGQLPVYDETDEPNEAICTFAGDRACFLEGDRIIIHCFDRSYKEMELLRDDKLVTTLRLRKKMLVNNEILGIRGGLSLDPGAYAVDLAGLKLGPGSYTARLKKGNKHSEGTRFEIIRCSVQADETGGVRFQAENATPVFWNVGRSALAQPLSGQELQEGRFEPGPLPSYAKSIKVHFQGRYGRVARSIPWDPVAK